MTTAQEQPKKIPPTNHNSSETPTNRTLPKIQKLLTITITKPSHPPTTTQMTEHSEIGGKKHHHHVFHFKNSKKNESKEENINDP